jgi:putative SOS response-associated peptidase YedK
MCGRFTLRASPKLVEETLGLYDNLPAELTPRYNVAPTQMVLAVRQTGVTPEYCSLRWGLIPSWADDASIAHRLINARADGIAEKPAFRAAFKRRRCLIVADGFYEWTTLPPPDAEPGSKKKPKAVKQPYHVHRPDHRPFAIAGLWETWSKGDKPLETCTIVTTTANGLMGPLHDRMPVILDPRDYARWLNPEPNDPALLLEMLRPCPDEWMVAEPVSTAINDPKRDGADCLVRASAMQEPQSNDLF